MASEQKNEKISFKKATAGTPPTQWFLDISEIKENSIVLKDGSLRSILLVASLNFDLKSEEEQEAIISNYVNFLNTLEFPLQIVVQSRLLNIDAYLEDLVHKEQEQSNELLRLQIADYRQALQELIELGQIMTKKFYVVVPYMAGSMKPKGFWSRLINLFSPTLVLRLQKKTFDAYRRELDRRVEKVSSSLQTIGLNAIELDTISLIELFYSTYNPDLANKQQLNKPEEIQIEQ